MSKVRERVSSDPETQVKNSTEDLLWTPSEHERGTFHFISATTDPCSAFATGLEGQEGRVRFPEDERKNGR